ncbi:MAG: hypothetical protein QM713_15455 [Arachnia sp.]
MRIESIVREAWRDIESGAVRLPALGLILAIVFCGGVGVDVLVIRSLVDSASRFQQIGGSVFIIQAPRRIHGPACESLNGVAGVRAAGAIRALEEDLNPRLLPDSSLLVYEMTDSMPSVLRAPTRGPGLYVSESVAEVLSLDAGARIAFNDGVESVIAGVFPWDESDGRRPGFGSTALVPGRSDEPFDECWVDIWPTTSSVRDLQLLTVTAGDHEDPPQTSQLNTSMGAEFDGFRQFVERPTRWAPVGASVFALALGYLVTFRRRLEIASDLHAGATRSDVALKHMLELAAVGVTGAALAAVGLLFFATFFRFGGGSGAVVAVWGWGSLALSCAPVVGCAASLLRIRERDLFRFFQRR